MCALNDKPGYPPRIDRNLARSRALTFTFSTQYALTKELKPLKCIMPYMNVVHQTAQPHTGAHQDSKRQLMGLGAAHTASKDVHRDVAVRSICMHAALRRPPVYVISMQNRLARNLTPGYTIAHDRRHQGAKRMVEFTGAMWWWLLWRIHACLQPCQCSRGLYTASTPITARRNYTPFTYLQNHGMGQGLGDG